MTLFFFFAFCCKFINITTVFSCVDEPEINGLIISIFSFPVNATFTVGSMFLFSRVDHFAALYAAKLGVNAEVLKKTLWGDFYLEGKTKMVRKGAQVR